ncbi:bifunctional phosphopantothenoylcysteine decarboxylase/phosphopantothenate--cysteine ligase CoaBC [Paenibacillus sp. SYP-B4298]|uniref:bifunctional phosphopantothenoylcysteine decarboxylase/phosphopantothenate--cysteine ligase CoaBC n=1 Tax=Paenibacillus sp. SYP-B4298 TaxID=2996034 RepID=UPI0022DE8066|nr:bifunctional phosphopantothenoylcysteine decarboxylase/phosphopantothenate--cysteine ligase CoaBC [Paenibacillus sp. SYP-B4298]
MLKGKTIVLGVSGGIAAYKAAALCSKLTQQGASVRVIMTDSAARFIAPLTLQVLSKHPVYTDTFDEKDPSVVAHIDLADHADLIIVAPATANVIAKMAHGLADDMLSTTLLAATAPVLVAPAMNVHMYAHPAVQHNMELLAARGVRFIEPGEGLLACGYVGKGRLAEPEDIVEAVRQYFGRTELLKGRRVLVTAGGTMERIDPVRYLTNDSSGKMGFAIAAAAAEHGAEVVVVAARTSAPPPAGVELVRVESAQQMLEAVLERFDQSDIVVKAAAVADYRPIHMHGEKLKKQGAGLVLELEKTPDILETLGARKRHQLLIGFAAETSQVEHYAMDKLHRKNCDLIVANDVSQEGAGFHGDTNIVQLFDAAGLVDAWPMLSKREVAERLVRLAAERLQRRLGAEQS